MMSFIRFAPFFIIVAAKKDVSSSLDASWGCVFNNGQSLPSIVGRD